jgi:hypothetical protein
MIRKMGSVASRVQPASPLRRPEKSGFRKQILRHAIFSE